MKPLVLPRITFFLPLLLAVVLSAHAQDKAAGGPPSSTIPDDKNFRAHQPYQTQMEDYLALMKGRPCDIIFIGDSITEQWRWGAGKPVWDKNFANRALDFGEGSDRTQNTIWRLKNIPLDSFTPKVAVILIGTNNFQDPPEVIAAGVKAVINTTREKFAGIKVILVSILPNARATTKMIETNQLIQDLDDGRTVFYLDLASKFTPTGDNWKGLGRDKLHLTEEGYEMWATELNKLLPQLIK